MSLRKAVLLLATLLLVGAVANAQVPPSIQCVANAGVPPLIRAEGLAELVGDLVLNCNGGTPTAPGQPVPKVTIRVFLNTNVTSHIMKVDGAINWSEAVLAIDDPAPANQNVCGPNDSEWDSATKTCNLTGVGGSGIPYSSGTVPNVYQGRYISPNILEWVGVPIDPPGTFGTRVIRITNVRVNANQLGVSGSLIPTQVVMYISTNPFQLLPVNNPQQVVAWVQQGLDFEATSMNFFVCEAEGSDSGCGDVEAKFKERFATAFKVKEDDENAGNQDGYTGQPVFGFAYNTESGWYNPASSVQNDLQDNVTGVVGWASQGTRLRLVFSNVPSGVDIYVRQIQCEGLAAQLVGTTGDGWTKVTISGGAGEAIWEVTGHAPYSSDIVGIGIDIRYSAGGPALGTAMVTGSYAPLSSWTTARTDNLQPRFVDMGIAPVKLFSIVACSTTLLYPFVTNQAGFDTGLVIANTSKDPFGTPTQQGACTLYYYGFTTGGGPAPAPVTTPVIPAGQQAVWTLSSGGAVMPSGGAIPAAPGFQGYIIARCDFQYAHGYAFISDLGAQKLAQGYLALVMSKPSLWRSGDYSEAFDQ